jgi:tetratricopeptide (TPR) repeat protein
MLSQAYALSASYEVLPDGEAWPRAESAALTAVSLDDGLSNAHLASALVVDRAWRWAEAGREFRRAIELNANNADARAKYSNHLSNMGQVEEAIEEAKRAETLDPLSPIIVATVGSRFYYARRYDEAIAQYRKALELEPNFAVAHYDLARAYEQKGRLQEAIAESESAVKLFGRSPLFLGALGHIYATSSKRAEALELVDEMQQPAMKSLTPYFNSAKIYVGLGEKNKAFEQLASAYKEHSIWLATITVDPVFDPLRSDPRFADILRRMGLQQ